MDNTIYILILSYLMSNSMESILADGFYTIDDEFLFDRVKRQAATTAPETTPSGSTSLGDDCSFKATGLDVDTCNLIVNMDKFHEVGRWEAGTGAGSNWVGGPPVDGSNDPKGGYLFVSLATLANNGHRMASVLTTPRNSTGPKGRCLEFRYIISGLDLDCLGIYLTEYPYNTTLVADDFMVKENNSYPIVMHTRSLSCERNDFSENNTWSTAKISFSSNTLYSIGFFAETSRDSLMTRGYVAVDDIKFTEGSCEDDCLFNSDFCQFTNSETDDFDWSLSRGSLSIDTGPSKDQSSSISNDIEIGGYAYIDSGWPRRPGDIATLVSAEIPGSKDPKCFSFWMNLHGGEVGGIRINKVVGTESTMLWHYKGTNRNLDIWVPGQLTIFSPAGESYKIEIQGIVGEPGSGDIAIDTIKILDGPCPMLPTSSDPNGLDCTFFDDKCSWLGRELSKNGIPNTTYPMISRVGGTSQQPNGHTKTAYNVTDMYIKFDLSSFWHGPRNKAAILSKTINSTEPLCLTFWYYMQIGISLRSKIAALSVVAFYKDGTNETLWRLISRDTSKWNFAQKSVTMKIPGEIGIVVTKGPNIAGAMIGIDDIAFYDADCPTIPLEAVVSPVDCTFDVNQCDWKIENPESRNSPVDNWRYVEKDNFMPDNTYYKVTGGYIFIEAFSNSLTSHFVSPPINSSNSDYCLTFYFAAYYKDATAQLSVKRKNAAGEVVTLWKVMQDLPDLKIQTKGNSIVSWTYGQVPLTRSPGDAEEFQVYIEGKVTMGTWTLDDIKLIQEDTPCATRPKGSNPNESQPSEPSVNPAEKVTNVNPPATTQPPVPT